MTADQSELGFDPEQQNFPGVERTKIATEEGPIQSPLMTVLSEALPGRGQISFDADQQELTPIEPGPMQLAMLPEPPPWEEANEPPSPRPKGRLSKKRSRSGITPGQSTLF